MRPHVDGREGIFANLAQDDAVTSLGVDDEMIAEPLERTEAKARQVRRVDEESQRLDGGLLPIGRERLERTLEAILYGDRRHCQATRSDR